MPKLNVRRKWWYKWEATAEKLKKRKGTKRDVTLSPSIGYYAQVRFLAPECRDDWVSDIDGMLAAHI